MLGLEVHALLTGVELREQAHRAFSMFAATGSVKSAGKVLELTARRKDGREFPVEMSISGFRLPGAWGAAAILRDITERKRIRDRLERDRRTLERMLRASDHERQLVAYDIHDGLAQHLAGALMQFDVYQVVKNSNPQQAEAVYEAGVAMLRQSHAEARRLISGIRPPILDEFGVVAAITHLVHDLEASGAGKIAFRCNVQFSRLSPILENALYRIVQEGLTNAVKHSQSQRFRVSRCCTAPIRSGCWSAIGEPASCPPRNNTINSDSRASANARACWEGSAAFAVAPAKGLRSVWNCRSWRRRRSNRASCRSRSLRKMPRPHREFETG